MRSDPPLKLIVKVDRKQGFVCIQYWYYWNHDGYELRDDYEPIFVYVKPSGEIHALAFRVHYNWRIKFEPIVEDSHVVITFLTSYHTPVNNYPPLNVSEYFIEFSLPPSLDEVPEDINPWDIVSIEGYPTLQQLIRSIILSLGVSILVTLGTLFVYANIRLLRD